jgi:DNA helicase HerA-like ATPase
MSPALNKIIQYGRHKNVGLIGSARRPSRVVRDLTANASSVIIYNIQEPRDLKYLEEFCGKDFAFMAQYLDIGEYVHYPPDEESRKELLG